jgi:hypothetical protein
MRVSSVERLCFFTAVVQRTSRPVKWVIVFAESGALVSVSAFQTPRPFAILLARTYAWLPFADPFSFWPNRSAPSLQRMNQVCNQPHICIMTVSHGDRRLADVPGRSSVTNRPCRSQLQTSDSVTVAANQHWGLRSESSSEIGTIAPAVLAIFKSDNGADERVAPPLDVGDVSVAKLAVAKRLAATWTRRFPSSTVPLPDRWRVFSVASSFATVSGTGCRIAQRRITGGFDEARSPCGPMQPIGFVGPSVSF